jgi:hypothetical protein
MKNLHASTSPLAQVVARRAENTVELLKDSDAYAKAAAQQRAQRQARTADGFQPTNREMREAKRRLARLAAGRWPGQGDPAAARSIALAQRTVAVVKQDREEIAEQADIDADKADADKQYRDLLRQTIHQYDFVQLREVCRYFNIKPARSKMETVERIREIL